MGPTRMSAAISRAGRSRALLVAAALVLGGYAGYSAVGGQLDKVAAQDSAVAAAAPVVALCDTGQRRTVENAGGSCERAYDTVRTLAGKPGADGAAGPEGRGVRASTITAEGRLQITYTDGATVDLGVVVGTTGAAGATGATGPDGRGITGTALANGRLIVTYSDGTTVDVGQVVGRNGRSIDSSTITTEGRLQITYDDGTTEDAGALPPGPPGPPGPACPPPYLPVETGQATGADGRVYTRSVTCVDPESLQAPPSQAPPSQMPPAAPPTPAPTPGPLD